MSPVGSLPVDLQRTLGGRDVIVIDDECVLRSGFCRFDVAARLQLIGPLIRYRGRLTPEA